MRENKVPESDEKSPAEGTALNALVVGAWGCFVGIQAVPLLLRNSFEFAPFQAVFRIEPFARKERGRRCGGSLAAGALGASRRRPSAAFAPNRAE